jgi:hypothetical protein
VEGKGENSFMKFWTALQLTYAPLGTPNTIRFSYVDIHVFFNEWQFALQPSQEQHALYQQYCEDNFQPDGTGRVATQAQHPANPTSAATVAQASTDQHVYIHDHEFVAGPQPEDFALDDDSQHAVEDKPHQQGDPHLCCGYGAAHYSRLPLPSLSEEGTACVDGNSSENLDLIANGLAKLESLAAESVKVPRTQGAGTSHAKRDAPNEIDWVHSFTPAAARQVQFPRASFLHCDATTTSHVQFKA